MLQFLQSIFPDHDPEILQKIIKHHNNNIDDCIQSLLADDALEADEDLQQLCSIFPQYDLEYLYKTYMDMDSKLEPTIEQILAKHSLIESKNQIILPKTIAKAKNSSFKWTIEMLNHAKELEHAFPQFDQESIKDILEANDGKIALAAKELSDLVSRNDNQSQRIDEQLSTLATMFPDTSASELTAIIKKGHTLEENIESLLSQENSVSSMNVWNQPVSTRLKAKKAQEHLFEIIVNQSDIRTNEPDYSILKSVSYHTDHTDIGTSKIHLDPREKRKKAQDLICQRNELFERAASAYKKGKLTGLSSASFYAQQARDLNAKIKIANEEACKAQMEFNHKIHGYNEAILDLHGLTVSESLQVLKDKTESWTSKKPLRIITGAGNHSKGNSKLLPSSMNYIKKIGWKIDQDKVGNGWFDARL